MPDRQAGQAGATNAYTRHQAGQESGAHLRSKARCSAAALMAPVPTPSTCGVPCIAAQQATWLWRGRPRQQAAAAPPLGRLTRPGAGAHASPTTPLRAHSAAAHLALLGRRRFLLLGGGLHDVKGGGRGRLLPLLPLCLAGGAVHLILIFRLLLLQLSSHRLVQRRRLRCILQQPAQAAASAAPGQARSRHPPCAAASASCRRHRLLPAPRPPAGWWDGKG